MTKKILKIGTRSSPLALIQAHMLQNALQRAHSEVKIEIIPVQSAADWQKNDPEQALDTENGGKGQFAKEIEVLIQQGQVDCGVHSLKDMESFLPEGLAIDHYMPRANPHDSFVSKYCANIMGLPEGASLGTCSPRRGAFALMQRPDLKIVPFRGNVKTRLDKIEAGQVDATYLAMAGLERLGIESRMIHKVSIEDMLPACGQGIICIERRADDHETSDLLGAIHHVETGLCAVAERAVLKALNGSCHTPIGAYAVMRGSEIYLRATVASLDGSKVYSQEISQNCKDPAQAEEIGEALGRAIKVQLPDGFLDA